MLKLFRECEKGANVLKTIIFSLMLVLMSVSVISASEWSSGGAFDVGDSQCVTDKNCFDDVGAGFACVTALCEDCNTLPVPQPGECQGFDGIGCQLISHGGSACGGGICSSGGVCDTTPDCSTPILQS